MLAYKQNQAGVVINTSHNADYRAKNISIDKEK